MSRQKFLHDIATKVTTSQLSLEVVMQKVASGMPLDSDDFESIQFAYEAVCESGQLIRKERDQKKEIGLAELPLLPTDKARKLLVVDDDPVIRRLLSQIFTNAGYTVFNAADGNAAIGIINKERVDVVLTDLRMPGGDGGQLAEQIRGMDHQPVLCLMSGDSNYLEFIQTRVQPDGVIPKPFSQQILVDEVYRAQVIKVQAA